MIKLKLKKYLVTPLVLIALIGVSGTTLAHDNDKREHRHADKEYTTKYRHIDDNPKYRSIRKHSHKPYGLVTIRKQYSNWRGNGHGYGHKYGKGHAKGHHHKPVKYVYVPVSKHRHHNYDHHSGYSLKYFGDNFSIGLRQWH